MGRKVNTNIINIIIGEIIKPNNRPILFQIRFGNTKYFGKKNDNIKIIIETNNAHKLIFLSKNSG